jgi:hypothetical protein
MNSTRLDLEIHRLTLASKGRIEKDSYGWVRSPFSTVLYGSSGGTTPVPCCPCLPALALHAGVRGTYGVSTPCGDTVTVLRTSILEGNNADQRSSRLAAAPIKVTDRLSIGTGLLGAPNIRHDTANSRKVCPSKTLLGRWILPLGYPAVLVLRTVNSVQRESSRSSSWCRYAN